MTSSLGLNKDSIDACTQIVSNSTKVWQYKKRQEWMRNESIDIMSQSNQSEIVSSSPSIDLVDNDDNYHHNQSIDLVGDDDNNHHNQSEPSTNDSIYMGGTTPVTHIENLINTFEMQSTNPHHNQTHSTHPHLNIKNRQLIGKKNKNEIRFSRSISNKQRIYNLKEQEDSNEIHNCDRVNSSPQCCMTQVHDVIITQQKLSDKTSNYSNSSTQDYEYENIKNSQNQTNVPCFKSQHKELMQTRRWSNMNPFVNPGSEYVYKENTCTLKNPSHTNPMTPRIHMNHTSNFRNSFNNLVNKVPSTNSKDEIKPDDSLAKNERKVTFSMQNVRHVRASTQNIPVDRNNTSFDPVEGSHCSNNQHTWTNDPNHLENNYIPGESYTPEDSYTSENEHALENEYNSEMGDDVENNRMEVGTYCEPSATQHYPREMEEKSSNYYDPDRDLQSFDNLQENNRPEHLYTNYPYSAEPSTSSSNFKHPCTENENNGFPEDFVNSENDECVSEEYNGSEYFEENGSYDENGDYSCGEVEENYPRYNNESAGFDNYNRNGNNDTQDESVSCTDRSFETDQMGNNRRRSYATFDTSQKSVDDDRKAANTMLCKLGSFVDVEEEQEEPELLSDPQIELRRSSQVVQELEKMKMECGESVEVQKEIEKMVQKEQGLSIALRQEIEKQQQEIEKQSQIEIKESLQEELEDELEVGLEECLNPDMQGMEKSIFQLFVKAETEMESLEIRVKAERNRGDIIPKPPTEMEGYKIRKEEREKVLQKKLMGTLSAIVDGNPRQPTTANTCKFCNSEANEQLDDGGGTLKLTIVTDEEIRLLIQKNEVESKNLAQRIHYTLNAKPIVASAKQQALDPSSV